MISCLKDVQLYGGAIKCAIPSSFVDVSQIRQVPDHQEVFMDMHTDCCFTVEILEYENTHIDINDAAQYFFNDLACANKASHKQIFSVRTLEQHEIPNITVSNEQKILVIGEQKIAKFNEGAEAENLVNIYIAILRLPDYKSDILLTYSDSRMISPSSSSFNPTISIKENALQEFFEMIKTFNILNFDLFA